MSKHKKKKGGKPQNHNQQQKPQNKPAQAKPVQEQPAVKEPAAPAAPAPVVPTEPAAPVRTEAKKGLTKQQKILAAVLCVCLLAGIVWLCAAQGVFGKTPADVPSADTNVTVDGQELTPLQQYWNRPWYGLICAEEGTGKYADMEPMDVHVTVKADANDMAQIVVYIDPDEAPFAACYGKISADRFVAQTGAVLDSTVQANKWALLKSAYPDMYALMDTYTDSDGDTLTYMLFMKPWGEDWSEPIAGNHIVPPNYHLTYKNAIAAGKASPVAGR